MNDIEKQQRLVFLRAEGWSFARIAEDLQVSKPTLINWSRKFRFEIQNQRAVIIDSLQEKWLATRDVRVTALGEQLAKSNRNSPSATSPPFRPHVSMRSPSPCAAR